MNAYASLMENNMTNEDDRNYSNRFQLLYPIVSCDHWGINYNTDPIISDLASLLIIFFIVIFFLQVATMNADFERSDFENLTFDLDLK